MLNGLSSIHRLLLCLLLSASVHGGLVLYDGGLSLAESRPVRTPVKVSLLPAVDIAAPALEEKSQAPLETVTSGSMPRVAAAKQTRVDPQTKSLASKVTTTKALPTKPLLVPMSPLLAIAVDEPPKEIVPVELMCVAPQEV
ncbi:MAG: hypothetical protein L3J79_06840, partial [Candidatus Marinimicrobia bacterium]|nr:hypothetical protein [Candidatus Neomarinimicrobiota bacterium]